MDSSHGLLRPADEPILVAAMLLLKNTQHPLRVLSLGAGVTWNSDERFGRPFIEEYMKTLWKERVQIVCSDILGTHDDFVVFGPRHSGANISCFGGFKLKSEEIAKDCSDEVAVMNKSEVLRC